MRQPYAAIGSAALELLLEQVSNIGARGRKVLLETELIVRGTTGPPP
jgi:DNA-binding LacI/PurR family transcriptional regulator